MDMMIGKMLDDRYELESLIGVGGMANVYKAKDLKLERTVAVKMLRPEFLHNEEVLRRFKNESKALSVLKHPNVVKVFDVYISETINYIVMEYLDGITLKEYMKQTNAPFSWRDAVHFIGQILDALDNAHKQGVVHRDVKPQNIMLLPDGKLKMMDFGIARFSRDQSVAESSKAMGSVQYISPEQASGDPTDAAADVYSVGVILYEMLAGKLPFDSEDDLEIAKQHIHAAPPALQELAANIPQGLVEITEKAMSKNPELRYPSAGDMRADLIKLKQDPTILFGYTAMNMGAENEYISKPVKRMNEEVTMEQQNQNPSEKTLKKRRKGGIPILAILFGITVACVVATVYMCFNIFQESSNSMFDERAEVLLTDFVGRTRAEAEKDPGFDLLDIKFVEEYNSNYEAGIIYGQTPKAGRTVKEGQSVTLKVSLGTLYLPVPDVYGMQQAEAQKLLRDNGLTVTMRADYTASAPVGSVVATDPMVGTEVASGSTVTMYVRKEKVDITRTVPNIVGLSLEDAKTALKNSGLVLGTQVEGYSDLPAGTVAQQSIAPDTKVRVNTSVMVLVSIGPMPVIVTPEPLPPEENTEQPGTEPTPAPEYTPAPDAGAQVAAALHALVGDALNKIPHGEHNGAAAEGAA